MPSPECEWNPAIVEVQDQKKPWFIQFYCLRMFFLACRVQIRIKNKAQTSQPHEICCTLNSTAGDEKHFITNIFL